MIRILVSRSRYLSEPELVSGVLYKLFKDYPEGILKGVDTFAGELAMKV